MIEPRTPLLAGSSGQDSPNLAGWGTAVISRHLGKTNMQTFESFSAQNETPDLDAFSVTPEARRAFFVAMGQHIEQNLERLWLEPLQQPEALVSTIARRFSALCDLFNGNGVQSPIEQALGAALLWISVDWGGMPDVDYFGGPEAEQNAGVVASDDLNFSLSPQAMVAGYKVDFLLWFSRKRRVYGIAIECDGHDFHEKTKEQAARDKKRDRAILTAGFPVMRFTGSEIFKDAAGCAEQIRETLGDQLFRVSKESGLF